MFSVILKKMYVYSNYLLVFSLAWRPPAEKVLYSWLSACKFNFLCLILLPYSTHLATVIYLVCTATIHLGVHIYEVI